MTSPDDRSHTHDVGGRGAQETDLSGGEGQRTTVETAVLMKMDTSSVS